jgi:hypothetical protein
MYIFLKNYYQKMPPTSSVPYEETFWLVWIPSMSAYYKDIRFITGFISGFTMAAIIFSKANH